MLAACGMFCTTMVGWPGMCLARYLASGEVVVVADPVPDDHADLLVAVELMRGLGMSVE
jgi:hypothetical protein